MEKQAGNSFENLNCFNQLWLFQKLIFLFIQVYSSLYQHPTLLSIKFLFQSFSWPNPILCPLYLYFKTKAFFRLFHYKLLIFICDFTHLLTKRDFFILINSFFPIFNVQDSSLEFYTKIAIQSKGVMFKQIKLVLFFQLNL